VEKRAELSPHGVVKELGGDFLRDLCPPSSWDQKGDISSRLGAAEASLEAEMSEGKGTGEETRYLLDRCHCLRTNERWRKIRSNHPQVIRDRVAVHSFRLPPDVNRPHSIRRHLIDQQSDRQTALLEFRPMPYSLSSNRGT
jgi:hypothetical protein